MSFFVNYLLEKTEDTVYTVLQKPDMQNVKWIKKANKLLQGQTEIL